jgi:hypothetical protein
LSLIEVGQRIQSDVVPSFHLENQDASFLPPASLASRFACREKHGNSEEIAARRTE